MIHPDIFQLEINLDVIIGQKRRELDNLIPKVLNKLIVNVGNPCLESDGYVLEQEMNGLLFLEYGLKLDNLIAFESLQNV